MLMRLDCLEANLRREQNRREQATVRGSAQCVLASIDGCIEFLRGQCKAMGKAINEHVLAHDSLSQRITRLRTIPAVGDKTASAWLPSWVPTTLPAPNKWRRFSA